MSGIYSTNKIKNLNQLNDVVITDISNNDIIQYNASSGLWENKSDFTIDELDCRVLRVSETADIGGRLACVGVASFVDDEFVFQNGISNLGDVVYIDNVNNRVGINISNPEEDLEVDGSIQIDSANVARLKFQQSGPDPHALGEIDAEEDGTNGGDLQFFTKVDGGSVTEKLRINNVGAIGLGTSEEKFGIAGSVLTSNGEGTASSWNYPYFLRVYCDTIYQPTDNTIYTMRYWVNDTDFSTTNYNADFTGTGSTGGVWNCPKTGYYTMNLRARTSAPGGGSDDGNLVKSFISLERQPSGGSYTEIRESGISASTLESGSDDIYVFCPGFSAIVYGEVNDNFRARILLDQRVSGDSRYVSPGIQNTYWEIHRIV